MRQQGELKSIIHPCVYVADGVTVMPIEPQAAIMAAEAGVKVERI